MYTSRVVDGGAVMIAVTRKRTCEACAVKWRPHPMTLSPINVRIALSTRAALFVFNACCTRH